MLPAPVVNEEAKANYHHESDDEFLNHTKELLESGDIAKTKEYINNAFDAKAQYDSAALAWNGFKQLCLNKKYKEAHDYYFSERKEGDIMVHLRHSTPRFNFYSGVLWPLMKEYENYDDALEKYINLLKLEFYMEQMSITLGEADNNYFPEIYPAVIMELGCALTDSGNLDEALELCDDLAGAVYSLTNDKQFTNYMLTKYSASVFKIADQPETLKDVIEHYCEMLDEAIEGGGDKEEIDYYRNKAMELLK